MDDGEARTTGRLAIATGVVAAGSAVCLATYFVAGPPFGTVNDVGNAAIGVLSAVVAWRLRDRVLPTWRGVAVGSAVLGAAFTVAGSALVVSGTTGFFLAGLVSSIGFAGIGGWLVALNWSGRQFVDWPERLGQYGILTGGIMLIGIVALPGILLRLDDIATAPGWVWIAQLGWLGTYIAYPAWAVWMGIVQTRATSQIVVKGSGSRRPAALDPRQPPRGATAAEERPS